MRLYEATFIINPEKSEEEIEALLERVRGIITARGGEVVEEDRWGTKRMAYEINKKRTGFYVLLQFKGEPDVKNELERNFRLMDDIFRFIIVKAEGE